MQSSILSHLQQIHETYSWHILQVANGVKQNPHPLQDSLLNIA